MITLKQDDTAPALSATLKDSLGVVVPIVGASVLFKMREVGTDTTSVNSPAVIVDELGGVVEYRWSVGDTATIGVFDAEFEVTYSDGKVETFPNSRYIRVKIIGDL